MPLPLLPSLFFFISFATFISVVFIPFLRWAPCKCSSISQKITSNRFYFCLVKCNLHQSLCAVCTVHFLRLSFVHMNTHARVLFSLSLTHSVALSISPHPRHLLLLSSMRIVHLLFLIHIVRIVDIVLCAKLAASAPSHDCTMFSKP